MNIEDVYTAIQQGDLDTFKTYLSNEMTVSPATHEKLLSFLSYAVAQAQYDIVEYLVCDVGMSTKVIQNWLVKINYYGMLPKHGKDDYKIRKFLLDKCNGTGL